MIWQPIETAPTEGVILVYGPMWHEIAGNVGSFPVVAEVKRFANGVIGFVPIHEYTYALEVSPTHWIPIPDRFEARADIGSGQEIGHYEI